MTNICLMASSDFEDIDESALMLLVVVPNLKIKEADLFAAVKHWAAKECERKEMDSSDAANLRQVSFYYIYLHLPRTMYVFII